jgi:hypothetical protein
MDGLRFDHWTRSLAGSRRGLLRGVTAAIGGGILGSIGIRSADARTCQGTGTVCREHAVCCSKNCGPKDRTGRRRCQCDSPDDCPVTAGTCEATCIAGVCGVGTVVDLQTDSNNCGACGHQCGELRHCVDGICCNVSSDAVCDGVCINLSQSQENCGACGTDCDDILNHSSCVNGVCACTEGFFHCVDAEECHPMCSDDPVRYREDFESCVANRGECDRCLFVCHGTL